MQNHGPSGIATLGTLPRPMTTRTLVVCNQKGGCGKTTLVINVAACLAKSGARVLVVDLDAQRNATLGLGINPDNVTESIFDVLTRPKDVSLAQVVVQTAISGLHVAPACLELSAFECRVANELGRENRLKKALASVAAQYDYVFIDTPPSLGLLTVNALVAAREVLVPLQPHPFAFDGLGLLADTVERAREQLNPELAFSGIVVSMFDARKKILREIVAAAHAMPGLGDLVFTQTIRQNVKLTEATDMRAAIVNFAPESAGALDFSALTQEFVQRYENSRSKPDVQVEMQFESMKNRLLALNRLSKARLTEADSFGSQAEAQHQ